DEGRPDDGIAADARDRRVAEAELRQLVADLIREGSGARDEPDRALAEDLRGDDAHVRLPGRQRAGTVRPEHRDPARLEVVVDPDTVVDLQSLRYVVVSAVDGRHT